MRYTNIMLVAALAAGLAGCSSTGGPGQTTGMIGGGAAGALVGSQFGSGTGQVIATAVGTLGGAVLGGELGKRYDESGKRQQS